MTHARRGCSGVRAAAVASMATLLLALVVTPVGLASAAGGFTAGDLVVYRVGDGSATLSSAAAPVILDEFAPTGPGQTPALSLALPTTVGGGNNPLVASGSASSEGLLTLSTNGQFLMATGYDTTLPLAGVVGSSVARTVGEVDSNGTVNTSTLIPTAFSGNNIRSAASDNGTNIWAAGATNGLQYTTLGSTGATTAISNSATVNFRQVDIYGGQLYQGTGSQSLFRIGTVGSGLPTTSSQTITNLPGIPISSTSGTPLDSPYSYVLVSLGTAGSAVDTLYVVDSTIAILKYSLIGGTWTAEGSAAPTGVTGLEGLTASVSGSAVSLYATTPTTLYSYTDGSGPGATISGTFASLATAPTNESFRGVAFAPQPAPTQNVPEAPFAVALPIGALLLLGGWLFLRRRWASHAK